MNLGFNENFKLIKFKTLQKMSFFLQNPIYFIITFIESLTISESTPQSKVVLL